ncbi:HDOD domain-containing protein [Paucibacter sp. DJ2R-2]|uniref:HDOD domain-containing protein n=1 Tax=Paucibacter sp. DJ2R-2 TaxID=2893558 RepID=UPI0021E4859D|nr:HDOD domain-containing protein [Paucibacter sp. DJ2R-2]MCV2421802.1 HDOD domain-containing protein [Paucibacter sp. DJ4R-1]MCV2439581.1 HDOD domain-containing protein [Paucibacter sp. DJ2R-2]
MTSSSGSQERDADALPPPDAEAPADAGAALEAAPGQEAEAAAAIDPEEAERLAAQREAEEKEAAEREARLQRLMQKIAAHADFASMKDSVRSMQKVSRSEKAHTRALTGEISNDIAMTGKLLRLVNAAFYSSAGGGNITSMERAVALMGFQTIGMVASSLMLFERLPKTADGNRLRQEFGRAQMAALLAHEMCNSSKHIEGAYLNALFQNLGSMLAGMHFAEDTAAIEARLQAEGLLEGEPAWHDKREKLARQQWGLGFEEIGVEVAKSWGWPDSVRQAMRSLAPSSLERPAGPEEYQRVLCTAANRLAGDLLRLPGGGNAEERAEARKACVERFAAEMGVPLNLDPEVLPAVVEQVKLVWDDLAKALGFDPVPVPVKAKTAEKASEKAPEKAAAKPAPAPTPAARPAAAPAPANPVMAEALSAALERVSELVLSGAPAAKLLQLCMKEMQDALQLQRVIVCLRDPASGGLRGRMGMGDRAQELAPVFDIPLKPPSELFGLLCSKGADTLISDASDPVIAQRLPPWYGKQVRAQTFVLLPMVAGDQVLGAFYGDQAVAGRLQIGERELRLLKTLRNQVVMAMRFGGAAPGS